MSTPRHPSVDRSSPRRKWLRGALAAGLLAGTVGVIGSNAGATHGVATLSGSNFEIDDDANLKNDDGGTSVDWADLAHPNGPELRATDLATGQTDDSYKGGTKEDTECPNETTGSIPNNKSDLLTFHVYEEPGDPGFLNLAWSRVSDPSGTTLMDFEFNQSTTPCAQGPNVERTDGDILIEYAIDQGGARANISGRFWDDTAGEWGPSVDLDQPSAACGGNPCAVGTINNASAIPAAESDGLIAQGAKALRTFGEAQIDLDLIFDENTCTSFGSAMLKSRSSDSFTSQLKDFIRPIPIDLQNCGNVIIRKQTDPDEDPNSTVFGYTKNFPTDPSTGNTFTLTDDGVKSFNDDVLFGTGYTVTEDVIPSGWDFVSLDCSASSNVNYVVSGATVTFDIDSDQDELDCTYTNRARGAIVVEKVTNTRTGAFDFTSSTLSPAAFTLTTTATGEPGKDSRSFGDLTPGTYDVAESGPPTGWNLVSSTCDDGSDPATIGVSGGETVTCTFVNEPEVGALEITKTRKHAADGAGDHAHAGVTFEIRDGNDALVDTVVTESDGTVCVDGLLVSSFDGDYSVTEMVPAGYVADGATTKSATVVESVCDPGEGETGPATVSFSNTPLTNVDIAIDSQVDGGTSTVVECWEGTDTSGDPDYSLTTDPAAPDNGDGTLDNIDDLEPTAPGVTLTCLITVDP